MAGENDSWLGEFFDALAATATSGFGFGSSYVNAQSAQKIAEINAQYGQGVKGVGGGVPTPMPTVIYAPAPAPPAKDNTTRNIIYGVGGFILLGLVVGGIAWAIKTFGNKG